eukprot:c40461_g1_i1 orf=373-738(+)
MAGVWVFKKGVAKLVQNPQVEAIDGAQVEQWMRQRHESKVLVWLPTKQVICSYAELEEKLALLGWRRYIHSSSDHAARLQFHRSCSSSLLISLPADFRNFKSMHMFDIVLKNRHHFEVRNL